MALGVYISSKPSTSASLPNHHIKRQTLAQRTQIPGDVRLLDSDARRKGFPPEEIINVYTKARECCDMQLATAMEKRCYTRFVVMDDTTTGKKNYSLSLTKLNQGHNHDIFLEITKEHGCLVASELKKNKEKERKPDRPPEVKYHEKLKDCVNIIQLKAYGKDRCYFERANGDFSTLPRQIDNAPHLVRGLICGGVQMAEKGVMHLDLKIENILLGMDGESKITDFEMACFVNSQGIAEGHCVGGNLRHYSPERYDYALNRLQQQEESKNHQAEAKKQGLSIAVKKQCTPSDFHLGLQDNVWGLMMIISCLERTSKASWCQLGRAFQERFDAYIAFSKAVQDKGLKAGKEWSNPFRQEVYELMLNGLNQQNGDADLFVSKLEQQKEPNRQAVFIVNGLRNCLEGNLFGGLIPKTPLEDIVKCMAVINPQERITIEEALELFEVAVSNPFGYFEEVNEEYSKTESEQKTSDSSLAQSKGSSDSGESKSMPDLSSSV